jgi:hypothetical protein
MKMSIFVVVSGGAASVVPISRNAKRSVVFVEFSEETFQEICKLKLAERRLGPDPLRLLSIATLEIKNQNFSDAETTLTKLKAYVDDNMALKLEYSYLSELLEAERKGKEFVLEPVRPNLKGRKQFVKIVRKCKH